MLNYDALSKKPLIFKSFTGLEVPEFDAIYTKIRETHTAYEQKRLYREDRKRKSGAGHPFKLPLKDRLAMLPIYYRLYVTSTLPPSTSTSDRPTCLKIYACSSPW